MKVEVAVLGLRVPKSPYGLCGHKAVVNLNVAAAVFHSLPFRVAGVSAGVFLQPSGE